MHKWNRNKIKNIEKLGMNKQETLISSISRQSEDKINKLVKFCKANNIKITGNVLSSL